MKNIFRLVRKLSAGLLLASLLLLLFAGGFYGIKGYQMYRDAVNEKSLAERVEDVRGMEDFTPYSELPRFYIQATISVEDRRFWGHRGLDFIAIGRAAKRDLRAGAFEEGGSTITQQLAKNMLFTKEKKMERKAAEVFAVAALESEYTKEEIFELYVNMADFGGGYHGIRQAAKGYFEKEPSGLSDAESVLLAGVPNAPSAYSPDKNMKQAVRRAGQVLKSMVRDKVITQEEAKELAEDISVKRAGHRT